MWRTTRAVILAVGGFVLWPTLAVAQSGIAGQVTDNTGGVLPGVTVEATSPALIEGSRTVVTDGQGRYSIVNLRPGPYTMTFTLIGFGTSLREGIDLPAEFTAQIDAVLAVGALEETVTVSGEAPVVDVQTAARIQVLSREVLDNVVNTGALFSQAMLVPGVSMAGVDVGGSRYVNDLQLEARGANAKHTTVMQDGMSLDLAALEGVPVMYNQDLANQEVAVQAGGGGGNAEQQAGGVVLNIIPKEGGNTFSGQTYFGKTPGSWMADNLSDDLISRGVGDLGELNKIFDYSGAIGGPILRDKIWFFNSTRYWGVWGPVPDRLYNDGTVFTNEEDIISNVLRITTQLNSNNKFSVGLDRLNKRRGPIVQAEYPAVLLPGQRGPDPETAINYQNKGQGWGHAPYWQGQAKWTSTVSSRLLVEAGYSSVGVSDCCSDPMPGSTFDRGTPEWFQFVRKNDLDLGVQWDTVEDFSWYLPAQRYMAAVSYVTGSHNFKTGWDHQWGTEEQHRFSNGDMSEISYRSTGEWGAPDFVQTPQSVSIRNYPWIRKNELKYELAWYAQDAWTFDQVTLTGGIRADWLNARVPAQQVPAGRFVPARNFAPVENVPNWGPEWSPRLGVAFDVFGNARTALKASVGKYLTPTSTALANRVNPMSLQTFSIPWDDPNGDGIVQDAELDLTRLPQNFGVRRLDDIDPDLKREYNVETSVSVEHELMRGISVSAGWYRRAFHNILTTDVGYEGMFFYNRERTHDDFRAVDVVSPYNGEVFPVFDLKNAAEEALVDNLVTNPVGHKRIYTGFEFAVNARLPWGGNLISSLTTQRSITNECDFARDDPNELRFCDRFNLPARYNPVEFKNDFKFGGYFPLPYDMQVSLVFNSVVGRPTSDIQRVDELIETNWLIDRNTTYTDAGCAGLPCTPGALVIPDMVLSSITVPLAPAGTERNLPRQNIVNFSFQRTITTGGLEWTPQLEVYNLTNSDRWYSERSANVGSSSFGIPNQVLFGRMVRISVGTKW